MTDREAKAVEISEKIASGVIESLEDYPHTRVWTYGDIEYLEKSIRAVSLRGIKKMLRWEDDNEPAPG